MKVRLSVKTILFDLDGTLLPMDQDKFTKAYFKALTEKLVPHGYDPDALIKGIWAGTASMVRNDGQKTNEAVFWNAFAVIFGKESLEIKRCLMLSMWANLTVQSRCAVLIRMPALRFSR